MSLAVVGGLHTNRDGSNRLFEMALCRSGEPVTLVREPGNPIDSSAVAVFSARGIQLGYLSAERCGWIGARIVQGEDLCAVFHYAGGGVAVIRVSFDGDPPAIPRVEPATVTVPVDDSGFYPDEIPDDDWL